MFVLDTRHEAFVAAWASIYDTLLKWSLWRDQVSRMAESRLLIITALVCCCL